MLVVGRLEDWRRVGDSSGDLGDEGADERLLRNPLATCAVVGVPCLASLTMRLEAHAGESHAREAACAGE